MLLATWMAVAFGGVRCEASWSGPTDGCPIDGDLTGVATREHEGAAERAARRQLARILDLTADELVRAGASRHSAEFVLCDEVALERLEVDCDPDLGANDGDFCFVTFEDRECWDGTVLTVDHGGWRAVVDGRHAMCQAVDARIVAQGFVGAGELRRVCRERCAVETKVTCPPDR